MTPYDHKKVEKRMRTLWKKEGIYKTKEDISAHKPKSESRKSYVLDMFPYPSGDGLHVGHPKGYIATDVYSRMKQMQGYRILHPMGFDAFGLPAENYAIKNKIHPKKAVDKNIKTFKKQLELLGFNYDWDKEINTTDPRYYKWTQWMFIQMFKKGLAYRSNEPINWCPSCKTGLSNEDVEEGKCERCGSIVEKRPVPQWVLKITDYADRLLQDLEGLNWPESIKESQRNWIGRSEGLLFTAPVKDTELKVRTFSAHFEAFYADTFAVIAPDHPFLPKLVEGTKDETKVLAFADELVKKRAVAGFDELKKPEGIFTGRYIEDPIGNGDLPIWVANYAVADYGTGIVKASCHDERDFAFAKKYGISLKPVLFPEDETAREKVEKLEVCFTDMKKGILSKPKEFEGKRAGDFRKEIADFAVKNGFAERKINYRLRDWVFSRQRYWGEPIPLIFCPECKKSAENSKLQAPDSKQIQNSKFQFSKGEVVNPGWFAVPEKDLPVKLPNVKSYEPTGTGESPLANIKSFIDTLCPECGGPAKRETNTMPQWAGSSWYHIAYCISENLKSQETISKQITNSKFQNKVKNWLPVDLYVGGAEHATRHLIYARFWHKFLRDIGVLNTNEPFERLLHVGLIMAEDGKKMSKRYGNVINPDDIVNRLGADTLRVYEMFMGPFGQQIAWNADGMVGARRFIERVCRLREKILNSKSQDVLQPQNTTRGLETLLHQTIKKVGEDIEMFKFNTAISQLMILVNELEREEYVSRDTYEVLLKLVAPFAPHIADALWRELGNKKSIHVSNWPTHDPTKIVFHRVTMVAQVGGRVRDQFEADLEAGEDAIKEIAAKLPSVKKWLEGKAVVKTIFVKNKLINFVVR
ncbi:MAG: class I tRNA ligase family protein [bacterium]|nr:class I tRNA ligase family protein [bacterium]